MTSALENMAEEAAVKFELNAGQLLYEGEGGEALLSTAHHYTIRNYLKKVGEHMQICFVMCLHL